jgi:hypothetical protein
MASALRPFSRGSKEMVSPVAFQLRVVFKQAKRL